VATWAAAEGLALAQPERVRDSAFLASIRKLNPEVAIVVAFGQIFPRELLEIPRHGCINVHGSLLPRWRGAAPVQAALRARDAFTGVTTMIMEEGLDSGPMLRAAQTPIHGTENAGCLSARLAHLGAAVLLETLDALEAGALEARPQEEDEATHAPRLSKEDGRIDWTEPAPVVEAGIRAMTPWPGAFTTLHGAPLRVLAVAVADGDVVAPPGTVVDLAGCDLLVACGEGALAVQEVQRPGRRPVSGRDLWNGEHLRDGERLD
jgi:methionyl-tRNA formyltransferase